MEEKLPNGFIELNEDDFPFYKKPADIEAPVPWNPSSSSKMNKMFGVSNSPVEPIATNNSVLSGYHTSDIPSLKHAKEETDRNAKPSRNAQLFGYEVSEQQPTENTVLKSRNAIFDISHRMPSPAPEYRLQQDNSECFSTYRIQPKIIEKNYDPIAAIPRASFDSQKNKTAFLGINTSISKEKREEAVINIPSTPTKFHETSQRESVYLTFLPIQKYFLGEGQYSKVFRGTYTTASSQIEKPCAVKRMHRTPQAQKLAQTESYMLSHLSHNSIISLIDIKDEFHVKSEQDNQNPEFQTRLLLVLEFCEKGNLWDWSISHPKEIGSKLWLKWAQELASGMEAIHKAGIIHHDIKPHNILLTSVLDVKISDFGNASFVPESLTESSINLFKTEPSALATVIPGTPSSPNAQTLFDGLGKGTLAYSAPEVITPNSSYSFPVDMYSLGVTLYTVLSGNEPFGDCSSTVRMMMLIQRGFFQPESQPAVSKWKYSDPFDFSWQYPNGEKVDSRLVDSIVRLTKVDPNERPTASQLVTLLQSIQDL
ncbi:hypothetical protein HDV04_000813 [Boothiomyces sp. JEL0838]|nr:hypothetical protein HDV04_000813 [Boothiomyces sp. JEL0838]